MRNVHVFGAKLPDGQLAHQVVADGAPELGTAAQARHRNKRRADHSSSLKLEALHAVVGDGLADVLPDKQRIHRRQADADNFSV